MEDVAKKHTLSSNHIYVLPLDMVREFSQGRMETSLPFENADETVECIEVHVFRYHQNSKLSK